MVNLSKIIVTAGLVGIIASSNHGYTTLSNCELENRLDSVQYSSTKEKFLDIVHSNWAKNITYGYGDKNPSSGDLDCSGFVYYVLDESLDGKQTSLDEAIEGRSINNTAVVHFVDMFSKYGTVEKNMPQDFGNKVGDVVFLKGNKFRHIGFIIRENRDLRIIHNTSNSGGYSNEIWNESAWKRRGWDVEYGSLSLDDKVKINN